jgi:hypothetical protein
MPRRLNVAERYFLSDSCLPNFKIGDSRMKIIPPLADLGFFLSIVAYAVIYWFVELRGRKLTERSVKPEQHTDALVEDKRLIQGALEELNNDRPTANVRKAIGNLTTVLQHLNAER